MLLENDTAVQKWVKPAKGNFQISYKGGEMYEPEFVIEADDCRYLAEVKRGDFMEDKVVLAKAAAAHVWCQNATHFTKTTDGKPWRYLLVPDHTVEKNLSLGWLAEHYGK